MEKKRKLLAKIEKSAQNGGNVHQMKQLEREINSLMYKEAQLWRQRSKIEWLRDGDRNTRFYHSKASQRRRRNYIKGLFDSNGVWCSQPSRVATIAVDFYQQLFSSDNPQDFDEVLD